MTDQEMLAAIRHIVNVNTFNIDDDDGEKYLSDRSYAMEAIDAILNNVNSGIVRQFMTAVIPE
jgi:hypothetical protein